MFQKDFKQDLKPIHVVFSHTVNSEVFNYSNILVSLRDVF